MRIMYLSDSTKKKHPKKHKSTTYHAKKDTSNKLIREVCHCSSALAILSSHDFMKNSEIAELNTCEI